MFSSGIAGCRHGLVESLHHELFPVELQVELGRAIAQSRIVRFMDQGSQLLVSAVHAGQADTPGKTTIVQCCGQLVVQCSQVVLVADRGGVVGIPDPHIFPLTNRRKNRCRGQV